MTTPAMIKVPVDLTDSNVKFAKNNWLEITCPQCNNVSRVDAPTLDGEHEVPFYCHHCFLNNEEYEEEIAYTVARDKTVHVSITKAPSFKGKITHCFLQKVTGDSL